jgi:hypothetical protein
MLWLNETAYKFMDNYFYCLCGLGVLCGKKGVDYAKAGEI